MRAVLLFSATFLLVFPLQANEKLSAVPGEYIVKLRGTVPLGELRQSLSATKARFVDGEKIFAVVNSSRSLSALRQTAAARDSRVEYIEPNFLYYADAVPNDPQYQLLWGLKNGGQTIKDVKGLDGVDISAEKAWDLTTGSRNVVVAVVDTGVEHKNADLIENMWVNAKEANGKATVDDDGNGYIDDVYGYDFYNNDGDPKDDNGHGSHVAGTIGAVGDNRAGLTGVSWKVRLMAIKFLGSGGSGSTEDAIRGIDYAVDNGAKIINASWGGGEFSKALEDTLKKARDKGVLFIASAGNSGRNTDQNPAYPSCYDLNNIISVAAVSNTGALAYFSNYGKETVDLAAPGFDIYSFGLGGFEYLSGTSMAAPHVSGVTALLLSREPNLSVAQIRERLLSTTKTLPELRGKTASGGMVNAYNVLTNQFDAEDPSRWPSVKADLKSAHPYAPDANVSYEIVAPSGTKGFSVHFSKLETEDRYDVIKIFDASGQLIWKISGQHDDEFSPMISGAKATVVLTTDGGNQKYGFDIDRLAIRP
ncbi:MAG: S8 family serine peptidase [Bdellovibrionia bacterium]